MSKRFKSKNTLFAYFSTHFSRMRPKISFKDSAFGWDGLSTFIFSNVLFVMTFGLFFVILLIRTLQIAIGTSTSLLSSSSTHTTLLIAGLRLENNSPTDEFKIRLNRVMALFEPIAEDSNQIIILGGLTSDNNVSEARAGADYLIAHGVNTKHIVTEDQSRHTLENLQNARALLLSQSDTLNDSDMAIISSRYHLYRILTLARGLNMTLQPIAAEDCFHLSFLHLLRLFKEAYYLHWYWSGKLWVFVTANKKSQARIT